MIPIISPVPIPVPLEEVYVADNPEIQAVDFSLNNSVNFNRCCQNSKNNHFETIAPVKIKENLILANETQPSSESLNESIPIPIEREFLTPEPIETDATDLGEPISIGENSSSLKTSPEIHNPSKITRLLTKSRQGKLREFQWETAQETSSPESVTVPIGESVNVVEVVADEQQYLDQEQVIKAKGNVVIRFANGILSADEVNINLPNRIAVAEGDVILKRGDQTIRGDRFEYYFVQDRGVVFNANGEIYQPNLSRDFATDPGNNPVPQQPLSWQIEKNQPLQRVVSAEGYQFVVGSVREYGLLAGGGASTGISTAGGGQVNRLRFVAEKVNFDSDGWQATNIRFTNDPFSPPEFEVVADTADLKNISPFMDELTTTNSRLVFDRTFSVPLFQDRLVFDRRDRNPGLFNIAFDGEDRGGLYIERQFDIYSNEKIEFTLTPQYLIQRALLPDSFEDIYAINPDDNGGIFNPSSFGLVAALDVDFTPRTQLISIANFTGLDLDNIDNRLRASLQLNQKIGDLSAPYNLSFQYNFRERLFNGSLGFQTVQNSIGAVITSPYIPLGNSGFGLVYQGSVQNVTADTDRLELLDANRTDNLTNLSRYQGAALLNGGFLLWTGNPLPATREEGLKYTSTPVAPYLKLNTSLTGVASYYSNGDTQPSLTGAIGFEGQIGHFSEPFLDYTGFNISYRQGLRGDESPFFFDRFSDTQVLSFGLTQQLYGPLRAGVQTFYNIELNEEISTDYFIEYSRRTYNIMVRYNPVLQIGSINLRISDFNWEGNPIPLEGTGIKPVVDGVTR